jgi:hypothetical protein
MKKLSAVLVNLQNPREKVWGILLSIQTSGITLLGIDLNSFEDWSRTAAKGEQDMGLSTVFFPIHRVERVSKDETVGSVPALADTFEQRVGQDVWSYLGLFRRLPADTVEGEAQESAWMTLREAERDYVERVLSDCDWDRAEAARLLGISVEALEAKMRDPDAPEDL